MPKAEADHHCHSIIFNRNILISGWINRNLWVYSIDIDSFSAISYEFAGHKTKILINAERLYLIECDYRERVIYESEIGSYMNWRPIGKAAIYCDTQVYCSYNKGGIYIGIVGINGSDYFKFDLNKKSLIRLKYS